MDDRAVELVEVAELVEGGGDEALLGSDIVGAVSDPRVRAFMPAEAWLILPTYDEAENIEPIVARRARRCCARAAPEAHRILIVDDDSPDGTGRIADRLAAEHEAVEVLHRTEREGLGPAYLAGFAYALDRGAAYVFEMDSDFSHDPADLARLLAAVRDGGADLALGSRYARGGAVRRLGARAPARQPRRLPLRAGGARRAGARPHRRLQVLPRRGAAGDRPADDPRAGLRVPGRADLPRAAARLPRRRGADHLPRPPARHVEDERPRSPSRRCSSSPRCASSAGARAADRPG